MAHNSQRLIDRTDLTYMSRPTGWFQVGWSHEYANGSVKPLHYFGQDFVAYRTQSGKLIIADAHCLHMGAHLGYGGAVVDECLRCPFHGWMWGDDGSNVEIPYSSGRYRGQGLRQYPVQEVSGLVFMWHASDESEPWWQMPEVPELVDAEHFHAAFPDAVKRWERAPLFPQFVLENTVDFAHVQCVHEWENVPVCELAQGSGEQFRSVFSGRIPSRNGSLQLQVDSIAYGVGFTINRLAGLRSTVQTLGVTPVDDLHSDLLISVAVERDGSDESEVPGVVGAIRHAQLVTAYEQDIPIWAHMKYNATPPYCREEVDAYRSLRKWSGQFYEHGGS